MPRTARIAPGGKVFHVINRGVGKQKLFFSDEDYNAFERVIQQTLDKRPMRILAYCLMPNHWHFVLWPENDGDLGRFMQRLTVTHVTRWQKNYNMVGFGYKCRSDLRADGARCRTFTARRAERHWKSGDQFLGRSWLPGFWFGGGYRFGWQQSRPAGVGRLPQDVLNPKPGESFETSIQKDLSVARTSGPMARGAGRLRLGEPNDFGTGPILFGTVNYSDCM